MSAAHDRVYEADKMLVGAAGEPNPPAAMAGYREAAESGSALGALRLAALLARGLGCAQDWPAAIGWLRRGAELGDADAQRQWLLLGGAPHATDWRSVAAIDLDALFSVPAIEPLSTMARVGAVRGFALPGFAEWFIERAQGQLVRGLAGDQYGGVQVQEARTALAHIFKMLDSDLIVAAMQQRAAKLTGLPVDHHEPPQAISYVVGQKHDSHYDFLDPQDAAAVLDKMGQRVTSILTYLTTDFEGGATRFPLIGLEFKGKNRGDAIVFSNVTPYGDPDTRTLHAGLPPTGGRKWVLAQALRNRVQPLR